MPIKITINKKPLPPQATVQLRVRKTLGGNLLISDHSKMDIVIVPQENKIMSIPKPDSGQNVYEYQKELMDSLFQGGVVIVDSVQGGPIYGVLEGTMGKTSNVDSVQVALLEIEKFILKSRADDFPAEEYDKHIEDRFTDPTDEDSTELGEIPPEEDEPYRKSVPNYTGYSFAGYGYLY